MYLTNVATCFSRTQYIAAFESKFSYAGGGSFGEEQKLASVTPGIVGGESRTGNGAEFRAFFYRPSVPRLSRDGGGRIVSSGVRKGDEGWGEVGCAVCATERAAECAVRPILVSRASFHQRGPLLCARKVPAEYIVGGTHARTTSFGDLRRRCLSSPPSGLRTRSTAAGLFEDSAQIAPGPELSMVDLRGGTRIVCRLLLSLSLIAFRFIAFVLRYRWTRHLIVPCFTHVRSSWKSPGYFFCEGKFDSSGRTSDDIIMTRYFLVTVRIM